MPMNETHSANEFRKSMLDLSLPHTIHKKRSKCKKQSRKIVDILSCYGRENFSNQAQNIEAIKAD